MQGKLSDLVERTRWAAEPAPEPAPEPYLIYPLDPTPEMIAELGAQCSRCGLVHDVTGRITGDRVWCPCGEWLTVRHTARVAAPPPPPDDVPLEEICSLALVSLRIALSISPLGERERALMARVDAEIAARQAPAGADDAIDEEPFGDLADGHALPTTHTLSLLVAPAPFHQLARRCYRLGVDVPHGYAGGLIAGNLPWYRSGRRRRPVHQQCPSRRRELWKQRLRRAYWHRVAEVMYWGKVA